MIEISVHDPHGLWQRFFFSEGLRETPEKQSGLTPRQAAPLNGSNDVTGPTHRRLKELAAAMPPGFWNLIFSLYIPKWYSTPSSTT